MLRPDGEQLGGGGGGGASVWEENDGYLIVRKPQSCQVLQLSEGKR